MDNPGQHLIHVTNRGPTVFGPNDVGEFKVSMKQPIKDVNKFGLLHYAVPKMIDHVLDEKFQIKITWFNEQTTYIDVTLPKADYYNCFATHHYDVGAGSDRDHQGRTKVRLCFDEILQSRINFAIMREYGKLMAQAVPRIVDLVLNRIGCIVMYHETTGTYSLHFGYKSEENVRAVPNQADGNAVRYMRYVGGRQVNTGSPFEPYRCITPQGLVVGGNGPAQNKPNPVPGRAGNITLLDPYGTIVAANAGDRQVFIDAADPTKFELLGLSMRLQLMMGFQTRDVTSVQNIQTVTRGRMQLRSYPMGGVNYPSGVHELKAPLPPNMNPPSMLYLQLTVPGTRSKILGQSDERGGWAIPTPSNQYVSTFINFPRGHKNFHNRNVRKKPVATTVDAFNMHMRQQGNGANRNSSGYNFDPFPMGYTAGGVGAPATRMWPKPLALANQPPAYNAADCVVPNTNGCPNMRNYNVDDNTIPLSPLIAFGEGTDNKDPVKRLVGFNGGNEIGMQCNTGFGLGGKRQNPVFTVSLIEPNFIFTSTENSTMQTFDLRLMWGDSSDTVRGLSGFPCQFSIIASP